MNFKKCLIFALKTATLRILKTTGFILAVLLTAYWLGPRPPTPDLDTTLPQLTENLAQLEDSIAYAESTLPNLKPDNESRIIWADSSRKRTEYALVYLHGFTAAYAEGKPINLEFAQRYGCNLYLPRLHAHGLEGDDSMKGLSADSLLSSAAHALAVGQRLGEKVILMSTSTGSTLSLILAADHPEIAALIAYSPNIRIADPNAWLLSQPWGLQLARLVTGGKYRQYEEREEYKRYWNTRYRLESLTALQSLLDHSMKPATFQKIAQPFFMGYYYKNEEEQDDVVSVPAMLEMYSQLSTPDPWKRKVAFPDVGRHALSSYLVSEDLESVRRETFRFAEEVLGMEPVGEEGSKD